MKTDLLDALKTTKFRLRNEFLPPYPPYVEEFIKSLEQYEEWLTYLVELPPEERDQDYIKAVDAYFWALNNLAEAHLRRFGKETPIYIH